MSPFIFSVIFLLTVVTDGFNNRPSSINRYSGNLLTNKNAFRSRHLRSQTTTEIIPSEDRKNLWKSISTCEQEAVELLLSGEDKNVLKAHKLLSKSILLKKKDPFFQLAESYAEAEEAGDEAECERLLAAMQNIGVPPHIANAVTKRNQLIMDTTSEEDIDDGSTFSDTVTGRLIQ